MRAWLARKAADRGKLSAPAVNWDKPAQALPPREVVWAKTRELVRVRGCLAERWEARGWPETRRAWAVRAPGWRAEWGLVRAWAAGCRWAAEWEADSEEPLWAEVRPWEVASVAAWEWEVAASVAAAWGAASEADMVAEAADTASTSLHKARGGQRSTAASDATLLRPLRMLARARVPQRSVSQCLKWRRPVRIIAIPCSSQAVTVSSSRFEPPG
jgi:hypothetical protein